MSSAILKSLLCLFSSVLPDTLTNFIKGIGLLGTLSQMLVEKRSKICLFPYTLKPNPPRKGIYSYRLLLQRSGCYTESKTAVVSSSPSPQPKSDIPARMDIVTWTHQLTQSCSLGLWAL